MEKREKKRKREKQKKELKKALAVFSSVLTAWLFLRKMFSRNRCEKK
jgi:hypothetical protein